MELLSAACGLNLFDDEVGVEVDSQISVAKSINFKISVKNGPIC
jgi:hypothetical protein